MGEILLRDESRAQSEFFGFQVATRSPMGAFVYGCGGIVIDGGWLRLLGSGCEQMKRGIYSFNLGKSFSEVGQMPSYLLVADDVLGGFFVVNGGAFGGKVGNVFYCVPDKRQMGRCTAWLLVVFILGALRRNIEIL